VTSTGINSITTTTGTALSVTNSTTIGGAGLTFRSISANGAPNGIVLINTGTSGGLTVTGTGSAGSGGTIQQTVGADGATAGNGVYLSNAADVSLAWMQISNAQNFAIRGTTVSGFTLTDSVVSGVNGTNAVTPFNEGSIAFTDLTGSASVTNTSVSGG